MLPIGVLAKKFMSDPAGRNRLLWTAIALVALIGAFASGLSINIQFGRAGGGDLAYTRMIDPTTGEEVLVDADGNVVDTEGNLIDGVDLAGAVAPTGGSGTAPRTGSIRSTTTVAGAAPTTPEAAAADAASACAGADLTATDQGVTKDAIKIGILVPNLNELEVAGFPVGIAGDFEKIMTAWTNEFNREKVACRNVTYVSRNFDVTSTDDMLRVCRELTQDEKVFSVVTPGGYDSVGQLCIAKDAKTPLVNAEPEPAEWYTQAAPYLWTLSTSKDRGHINHVRYLVEHGHIDKNSKIGVIYDGTPHVAPATEKGLLPELKAQGLTPTKVFKLSSDVEQALTQISQAVVDFQVSGVDFVFMPMNLIYKTQFMTSAGSQNYYPQYTESDHNFGCFDFTTSTYPAESYDRTICVTASDAYGRKDLEAFADKHPWAQYGDRVYFATYKEGYSADGKGSDSWNTQRALHISFGSSLRAWQLAANKVGPNLTRAAWGAAMAQLGDFADCVCEQPLNFGPDKHDATTTVKGLVWHAEASDGWKERLYREVTRPQKAYVQSFAP